MGEVEGVSDGNMTQEIDVDQVNSTVNNAESSPAVTETIDGYSFAIGGQPPLVWKPFSSNSWRTRLKRLKENMSVSKPVIIDEPSSSGFSRRYYSVYPCRVRCSSPDVVSNVEPQDLVKIAASASEAFEQVSDKLSKQKEGKDSKRGRKAATEKATTPSGRQSTKKRGREPEEKEEVVETPPPKGKSRKASKEVQPTPPKRPSREKEKPSAEPLEFEKKTSKEKTKKRSKSKKDKSKSPERTVREESEDEDVKVKADTPSSPDVKKVDDNKSAPKTHSKRSISASPVSTKTEEPVSAKKHKKKRSSSPAQSVNIDGWSTEKISEYFKLKEFTIDISDFPHHELQPSTSAQASVIKEKVKDDGSSGNVAEEGVNREKENVNVSIEDHKNRKRKRSPSSSSSCSCPSSAGGRKDNGSSRESESEQNAQTKSVSKKKNHSERTCVECARWLDDCVMDWKETLGMSSVWCSRECIERRVARAHEVLPEGYGALTLLRSDGQLLTTGPTLANLTEFIFKYPEYEPVLPGAKKKPAPKNEQTSESKKTSPKVLSKDSDRIRFNVKRAFSDALQKRAKMDKMKSSIKLCKDVSESVEAALFKHCQSNLNSPRYKTWTKAFIENVADCRNKCFYHRVLTGAIAVQKLVTLDGEDMRKPEYSASQDDIIVDEEKASEDKKSPSEVNDEEKHEKEVDKKEGSKNSSGKSTPRALRTASAKELSTPPSGKLTRISSAKSVKKVPRQGETPNAAASRSVSALDSILGDGNKDTTEQHLSHFYDVNCSICLAKQKSQAEAEKREREEKEKQRLEDKRFREMLPAESFTPYPSREPITIEDADYRRGSQGFDEMRRIPSPESTGAACASDEEYAGSYDGGGGSPGFPDRDTEPHDWIPAQDPPISGNWRSTIPVDPLITNSGLWSGQIFMNNSSMATSLYLISNPVAYRMVPTLPPVLRIKGRIVPVIVFDYVHETVKHGEHHVAVLRLTRPTDMEGEQRYISIYEDMRRKGRYFAVDVPPDSFFKDIYLLPLGPGEEPPAILLPFDGPGLPARHPAIILCVIVMYKRSRSRKLEPGKSYSRESLVDRSPRDAHFQIGPRVDKLSRSHSPNSVHGSATSDHENIGPSSALAENNDESAFPSTADQDDRDVKAGIPPQPNNPAAVLPDSTSTAENVKQEAEEPSSQGEAGPSTPPDPPPIDYAPVGEADNLLPSQFFTMAKKAAEAKEPVKVQSVDEIDTLPDLLVYIQLNSNPREIKEVVARFMMNPSLTDVDRELIRKKVMEKISAEKKKKAQSKKEPEAEEPTRSEAKKEPNTSLDRSPDTSGAIDFEALNNLSSFVGAGAQDLLKQAGERMEPLETRLPSSPPPPPPALPEDDDEGPSSASFVKVTEIKSSDLKVSEILPGPPPVPPVYGDDSSGGESPPERENTKGNDSSLHSKSSQQFHTMNIIPVPPPPSVMSGQLDIAVPPPPPPPPPLIPNATSAKQPFTPPPPPPPIFASSTNSSQSKSTPPLPVPPPVFRPPVVPYPGLPPPPPFVNLPPPLPGMIPPPPPPVIPGSLRPAPSSSLGVPPLGSTGSGQANDQKRVFSAGPSGNAPPGKPSTFGSVPELPPGSYMGSLAPLPSQLANASNPPKKPLPTGIIPSLGRALTERDMVPRTPTPPPSPKSQHNNNTSRSATKNGPRTPSPDMSKKRERELEIERLKKDIEEQQRRSAVMQAKIELAELEFQRKRGLVKTEQPSIKDNGGAVPEKPSATQAQEPSSSQAKHTDNDAMDIDGGESESEHVEAGDSGKPSDAEASLAAQWNEWGTSMRGRGVGMRGQPYGMPTGRPPLPPPGFRGRCALPRTPRGAPGRGGGFISPPEGSGYVAGQGGFFTPPPPSRGVRGAPNLRRGFPAAGRGGAFPMIPPPPLFGRGAGPHGPFRGSPRGIPPPPFGPPRGLPPMRGRFGPPPM